MPHAACGREEFVYFLEIYLYCTCRGIVASGHHPGLNEQIFAICVEKYGWWSLVYNSPRGLESLVPAVLRFPPPPILYLLCGIFAKYISNFCGPVALFTLFIILINLCYGTRVVICVVLFIAWCKCGNLSITRPPAKTLVTTRCSLGDFLRRTESFGSVWAKDCEESSGGRIE